MKSTSERNSKSQIIRKCEELIRTFDPIVYSIDTFCQEKLNDKHKESNGENQFIRQVVYGWYRERAILDAFIKNFYEDNASRILRADKYFFTVFSYLAIFRLEEMTFPVFKEYVLSDDPTKMYNFLEYLFNENNLNSCLKDDWIKVRDLSYIEDELIPTIEYHLPSVRKLLHELEQKASGLASASAAISAAKKSGLFGIKTTTKRELTRPISPKITQPTISIIPEPIRIENSFKANEVPMNVNDVTLAALEQRRQESIAKQRQSVQAKYASAQDLPILSKRTSAYTKKFTDLKKDIEEQRQKELAFDSSFVNIPPDFNKMPAKIKANKAAILREDYLFRKQQEKDVKLIQKYEEELRDASEYYRWQSEMKESDNIEKLKEVQNRRHYAKQAAVEAKESMHRHLQDNKKIADLMREQEDIIRHRKAIETQLEELNNRMAATKIAETRDTKPKLAVEVVLAAKADEGKKLRIELEQARLQKEMEDKKEQEELVDKIRQQRAQNTILKKEVKVFDPTEIAGPGFLCEMSYMEMKERLESLKRQYETLEMNKRQEIIQMKEKSAKDLEMRALNIQKIREKRAEATKLYYDEKERIKQEKLELEEKQRQESALQLQKELQEKREMKKKTQEQLQLEEERIKRQQQYLGAAVGAIEEAKYKELMLAKERREKELQEAAKKQAINDHRSNDRDLKNRRHVRHVELIESTKRNIQFEKDLINDKALALSRLREDFQQKKVLVSLGKQQYQRTKEVTSSHNPYAATVTAEELERSRKYRAQPAKS